MLTWWYKKFQFKSETSYKKIHIGLNDFSLTLKYVLNWKG